MAPALQQLMERFPPPKNPRFSPVNWTHIEQALDWTYPQHFKDYVDVYGGCVWFDNLSPFYGQGLTKKEAQEFPSEVQKMFRFDRDSPYDEDFNEISPSFYPADGGLMPFLVDYSSNNYYWDTGASDDREAWPIIQSRAGWMRAFPAMSIPTMILKWLEGDAVMTRMWGDVSDLSEDRRGITKS